MEDSYKDLEKAPAPVPADDIEEAATAEEMAEYVRQQAERRASRKVKKQEEDEGRTPDSQPSAENAEDPYTEPDPSLPWGEWKDNPFVWRGCDTCPEPYVPVDESTQLSCSKVSATNWMKGVRQPGAAPFDVVEVRFKNNRKDYFRLPDGLEVREGDLVAVEGQPGHDVGLVSLTGEVCRLQMRRKKIDPASENIRKVFRRAKPQDIERWRDTIQEEHAALIRTRQIAADLGLEMKVNDVEFQGDRSKAIFYYTADDRVDFRQLIKVLAEEFHARVEMKQIGVRQEAGKVGGIGTCGRELCCSTWLTNFKSVTTGAAKAQQILPNPQKLAGQCGKLKCCLNFEYEVYVDAMKKFPSTNAMIRFQKGLALPKKSDPLRGLMWYAYEGENDLYALPVEKVNEIIEMNRSQQYPERLEDYQVELMNAAALQQESSKAEFEQELRRLVEGGDGVVAEEAPSGKGDRREGRDHGRRQSGNGDNGNTGNRRRDNRQRGDRPERPARQERGDRQEGTSRPARQERQDRTERPERTELREAQNQEAPQERPSRNNDHRRSRNNHHRSRPDGENHEQ